jgi:hypothetical protein
MRYKRIHRGTSQAFTPGIDEVPPHVKNPYSGPGSKLGSSRRRFHEAPLKNAGADSREANMFEAAQEQKQSSSSSLWVGIFVVVAAVAVGTLFYVMSRNSAKAPAAVAAASAAPAGPADAVHDLKILSARMEKDSTGTTAVWLVDIDNKSRAYTYSNIAYETTYVGANNAALVVNKGTIAISLTPGEERNSQIRDVLYPAGTSWYKFRVTGATSKAQ